VPYSQPALNFSSSDVYLRKLIMTFSCWRTNSKPLPPYSARAI